MIAEDYNPELHLAEVMQWGKGWDTDYDSELLPHEGGYVPGLAAYFMYAVPECKMCFMENLVSNPEASKEEVKQALDILLLFVIEKAKARGYKVIYACSNNPKVIERAINTGATVEANYALITLTL